MRSNLARAVLLVVVALALASVGTYYFVLNPSPRAFEDLYDGEPEDVARLLMRDGTTGEAVTTEDPEMIASFFDLANSVTYTRDWDVKPRAGWRYYIDLFLESSSEVPDVRITYLGSKAEIGAARYDLSRDLSQYLVSVNE